MAGVRIEIVEGDVTTFAADALILKFSRSFHGADEAVARRITTAGGDVSRVAPAAGEVAFAVGDGLHVPTVVFVGTPRLGNLGYKDVGEVVTRGLAALSRSNQAVTHVALTLHGPGIGLDESQAFLSMLSALYAALAARTTPRHLERVTFVERNAGRALRLRALLDVAPRPTVAAAPADDPDNKPHIFVAMAFGRDTDDTFYYGIQRPIHAAGFLCERVDHASFTGDIVDRILTQIGTADLVIAECTGANPNVYLEIGYAWGKGRPTLLIARSPTELRFDTRGHRALFYDRIVDLETQLTAELARLPRARQPG